MTDLMIASIDELFDIIERDFPGWDYLFRSNFIEGCDATGSTKRYFANLIAPDFEARVLQTPLGFIDVSTGGRFNGYADTRMEALAIAYERATAAILPPN